MHVLLFDNTECNNKNEVNNTGQVSAGDILSGFFFLNLEYIRNIAPFYVNYYCLVAVCISPGKT